MQLRIVALAQYAHFFFKVTVKEITV